MIIVTGLGRCGTSILMKYFKEVGFNIGKNINWHDKARAGYELSTFYPLIDDLYHRYCKKGLPINLDDECLGKYWKGYTYRQALNKVDKDERQGSLSIVKDPRITWHPDIIESIWEARKDIKLLICHRRIESIRNSRKSLPVQYDDPKPRKELNEYKLDFSDFYTKVLELEIPHSMLFFPNFLRDFNTTRMKIIKSGLFYNDENGRIWNKVIDRSLLDGRT